MRNTTLGSRLPAPGSRLPAPGSRLPAPGSRLDYIAATKTRNRIVTSPLALAALATFALSGCLGGGGGGGSTTIPTRTEALTNPETAANVGTKSAEAANAQPNPGSVTQSSNVDEDGISTDQVEITAQYGSDGPSFMVHNGEEWSISTSDGNPLRLSGDGWQGVEMRKRIPGGTLYVDAYTDIEAPTTSTTSSCIGATLSAGQSCSYTAGGNDFTFEVDANGRGCHTGTDCSDMTVVLPSGFYANRDLDSGQYQIISLPAGATPVDNGNGETTTTSDADYLAGGIWVIVPDDATSVADYEFGAFGDGNDPFTSDIAGLTGTAEYEGEATGVYTETEEGSTDIRYFAADVGLTAEFGDATGLGTISGTVTNFIDVVEDEPVPGTVTLGSADITASDSGFFKGSVTGSDDERSYTGRWGGQFFGNDGVNPGSVGGTFGGHSMDDDYAASFVGVFGAHNTEE